MVNSSKTTISVVISFLVVTLMFSSFSGFEAFAARKDPNWGKIGTCSASDDGKRTTCCWTVGKMTLCQTCRTDVVATGANCGSVTSELSNRPEGISPDVTGEVAPPPPPPTQKCPENTVLGLKGKCIPLTNIPEDQQEATKQPLDNKPSKPNLPKGGSVLEQPQTGESTSK
jgi:hypothetical protein